MDTKHRISRLWKRKSHKELDLHDESNHTSDHPNSRPKSAGLLSRAFSPSHSKLDDSQRITIDQPSLGYGSVRPARDASPHRQDVFQQPAASAARNGDIETSPTHQIKRKSVASNEMSTVVPSSSRFSEDVADRNASQRMSRHSGRSSVMRRSVDVLDHDLPGYPRVMVEKSRCSEDVADRNMSVSASGSGNERSISHYTGALLQNDEGAHEQNAKNVHGDLSNEVEVPKPLFSNENGVALLGRTRLSLERDTDNTASAISSLRLDGSDEMTNNIHDQPLEISPKQTKEVDCSLIGDVTKEELALQGIHLSHSVDTAVTTKMAPAVTSEVVKPTVHHIREERITKEIHTHDVYHRILPIKDIEVLPARHYIRSSNGTLKEVPASSIPGASGLNQSWIIAETISKGNVSLVPRQFTARSFDAYEADFEEYVDPDGVTRSHTTWIHPPTLEEGGIRSGQTTAIYIDASNDRIISRKDLAA